MRKFLTALGFLTIIPVKYSLKSEEEFASSMVYFPVIGLLIGISLLFANFLLIFMFSKIIVDVLILIVLIVLTGGLHIDGFADTCDGFFSSRSKEGILNIMKDSRIGVMGLVGIISIILIKFASIHSLNNEAKSYALLLAPTISRCSMVVITSISTYSREGLGKLYIEHINKKIGIISGLITVAVIILVSYLLRRWRGILLVPVVYLIVLLISSYSKKKIGGITGDVIGATGEFIETTCFLLLAIK